MANDILRQGVQSISDIITGHGFINLDFADVKTIMKDSGYAHMGIGRAKGDNRAEEAALAAINSPILETSIDGARGVLLKISGSSLGILEVRQAAELIQQYVDPSANIIFGATMDETLGEEIEITVIATGFDTKKGPKIGSGFGLDKKPGVAPTGQYVRPESEGSSIFDKIKQENAEKESAKAEEADDEYEIPNFLKWNKN